LDLKPLIFDEAFEAEVKEAVAWYEPIGLNLSHDLQAEIQKGLNSILQNPKAWSFIKNPYRHKILSRFPYSIIYLEETDRILVLAFSHFKRKPDYWLKK